MLERLIFVVCITFMATAVNAQTLREAVTTTLRTNPDISASQYNVEAAKQLKRQAKGALYPSLDLVIAGGRESSNNTTTRASGSDDLRLTRKERSLRFTQLLYDGFSTQSLVEQQSALTEAALARLNGTRESISLRAIQLYLEVLRRGDVVRLANENLAHHDYCHEVIFQFGREQPHGDYFHEPFLHLIFAVVLPLGHDLYYHHFQMWFGMDVFWATGNPIYFEPFFTNFC